MTWMRLMLRWVLLIAVTVAVTVPLTRVGVPSAALFAALVVGIVLALTSLAPSRVPRKAGIAAQGVLGVYIGTMVHQDAVGALGSDWPIVIAIAVATLLLSVVAGALLGLHRDVTPLTGSLALVAGGASGLVAIARELGGDDRVVSVVQYLRVALVTASMPVVVTLVYHADKSHGAATVAETDSAPWYLSVGMLIALVLVGATVGRWIRLPGAGLLGPMALTVVLRTHRPVVRPVGADGAGAGRLHGDRLAGGVAFTRESLRAIGRHAARRDRPDRRARRRDRRPRRAAGARHRADPAGGLPGDQPRRCVRRAGDRRRNRVQRHVHHRRAGGAHPADAVRGAADGPQRGVDQRACRPSDSRDHRTRAGSPSASPTDGPPPAPRRGSAAGPSCPPPGSSPATPPAPRAPAARAAIVSCTVDMPTRSAPSVRSIRISAGVS